MKYCHFPNQNLTESRLLYKLTKNPFDEVAEGGSEKPKPSAEATKRRAALRVHVDDKIRVDVEAKYKAKEEDVKQFIRDVGVEKYKGWTTWNEQFAQKMGMEGVKPHLQVAALQRVVFKKLGIERDPAATIDGKLGPYTMAALAQYAKIQGEMPPVPKGNKRLEKAREAYKVEEGQKIKFVQKNSEAMEDYGTGQMEGATQLEDGSHLITAGGVDTYFRFHKGRWQWASQTQKDSDEWVDAGEKPWDTAKNPALAEVNALALKLSKARTAMQAGAGLLQAAQLQPDGTYKVSRGGRDVFFKFEHGQWQWASKTQKAKPAGTGWQKIGDDKYKDKSMKWANKLADNLKEVDAEPVPVAYSNPYGKPPVFLEGMYTPQQIAEYYNSVPGFEPFGGPTLPKGWVGQYYAAQAAIMGPPLPPDYEPPAETPPTVADLPPAPNYVLNPDFSVVGAGFLPGTPGYGMTPWGGVNWAEVARKAEEEEKES